MEILDDLLNDGDGWIDDLIGEAADTDVSFVGKTPQEIQEIVDRHSGPESDAVPAKKKGKRVAYSVACTLHISGSDYEVQLLSQSPGYDKGYRLNKREASKPTGYNVIQTDGVITCECGDFVHRPSEKGCKHVRALTDMGMFGASPVSRRTGSHVFDE